MLFTLSTVLGLLPKVGPVVAKLPEFKAMYDQAIKALHPKDQEEAKQGYADLIADNAEGHARLQEKLAAAAKAN
jgi:hypothetical protein